MSEPSRHGDLYELAKEFFRFSEDALSIKIILPTVPRSRSTLSCRNYPVFDCEVSPDDVLCAMRVYSLLAVSFRSRVDVEFPRGTVFPPPNAVFIGGPATNEHVADITCKFPIHFASDPSVRVFHGTQRDYSVGFSAGTGEDRSITEDYCLLSKCSDGRGVQFVIGGLRAYGQMATQSFLSDPDFYHQTRAVSCSEDGFQVLVRIPVAGRVYGKWEIVEMLDTVQPRRVFLSYAREDTESVERLRKELERRSIQVWQDTESIKGSEKWKRTIQKGIRECDYFIACFSKAAVSKRITYMAKELEMMCKDDWRRERQEAEPTTQENWIIPVRLDGCEIPDLPIAEDRNLSDIQWIDLFGRKGWEQGVQEIIQVIWRPKSG